MSGFDNVIDSGSRMLICPSNQNDRLDLQAIDQKTKEDLRERHKLFVQRDWECNTIAYLFVSNMCRIINSHVLQNGVQVLVHAAGSELNFYDLFKVSVTNKTNDDAEKTGNINVKFSVEARGENIIADYQNTDNTYVDPKIAYVFQDDLGLTNAFLKIDELTRMKAKEKYDVILSNEWMSVAITHIFIENVYRYMCEKIVQMDKKSVMINFNDIIEFHAMRDSKKGFVSKLRPGYGAKLIVKSDESTEADNDDGDDY